jgi:3-hydroxyacyl-[acyl-carrier-protein] dehydratase
MRFVFVDRVLALAPGASIETVKSVSATEDMFDDHFPGHPIFPGSLIVEVFDQACQLLIGASHGWQQVGRLERVSRASFRHFVRPGDRLLVRCERRGDAPPGPDAARWTLAASAGVEGRTVATATLEFAVEPVAACAWARARGQRLEALMRVGQWTPAELVGAP